MGKIEKIRKVANRVGGSQDGKLTMVATLSSLALLALVNLPVISSKNFFLCSVLDTGGSSIGSIPNPKNIVGGLILGAPIIGLVGGTIQYLSNSNSGDAKFKDIWQPALIGLAVPIFAIMIDSFVGSKLTLSCLWSF